MGCVDSSKSVISISMAYLVLKAMNTMLGVYDGYA
jgi:hypothetical protein